MADRPRDSMSIYTKPGSRVRFHGEGGYEHQQKEARATLLVGWAYEVEDIDVGTWESRVSLVGIPGRFNTVMFENVEDNSHG